MIIYDSRSPRGREEPQPRAFFDQVPLELDEYGQGRRWRDPDEVYLRRREQQLLKTKQPREVYYAPKRPRTDEDREADRIRAARYRARKKGLIP